MLKHVSFVTRDPHGVIAFYTNLGGTLAKDVTDPDGLRRLVIVFDNGGKLQFFHADRLVEPHSWMEHIAVELNDFTATVEQLRARGVRFSRDVHLSPGGNPVAFVLDPDGRHVELLQWGR